MYDVLVIGGGAAGFYGAIHIAEADPALQVGILERGKEVLTKVKVSGGGRCNVTHAEFDPGNLSANYPRGERELLGPFNRYACGDTMDFFQRRGVALKIEDDGRIFPETDTSQTIVDCFLKSAEELGIDLMYRSPVQDLIYRQEAFHWEVQTNNHIYRAKKLLLATGSNLKIWQLLGRLGHTIISPVPSLFTFNIRDPRLQDLQGISSRVHLSILGKTVEKGVSIRSHGNPATRKMVMDAEGQLLITHWGISGPAVLRLSAWGARLLSEHKYCFDIRINWLPDYHPGALKSLLQEIREVEGKKTILRTHAFDLPKRLWAKLVAASGIGRSQKWGELGKAQLTSLQQQLTASEFRVEGKSTFKEEFVTAGGVDLREIDFRTFESKLLPGLYFAGEIINVDAITGGFNFQNAWTGAYHAARAITSG